MFSMKFRLNLKLVKHCLYGTIVKPVESRRIIPDLPDSFTWKKSFSRLLSRIVACEVRLHSFIGLISYALFHVKTFVSSITPTRASTPALSTNACISVGHTKLRNLKNLALLALASNISLYL